LLTLNHVEAAQFAGLITENFNAPGATNGGSKEKVPMRKFLYDRATIIAVSLSFFAFGFVLAAEIYDLTATETITGLIAGAVCGITILVIEVANSMRTQHPVSGEVAEAGR